MENKETQEKEPLGVLFGVLAYNDTEEYEGYIKRLVDKSPQDMMLTIHSALRYAQARGVYSLEESEAISIVLRKLKN
jgi:hypothetical protein